MSLDTFSLPPSVAEIAEKLGAMPGVVAVVLGGSQGLADADARSDWDLAVYYRGVIELGALAAYGEVHPPGSWGRIMNGGAWLRRGDVEVDVLLRDLDVAEYWTRQAESGVWELDALLGYIAGLPTYSLAAELATGRVISGELPTVASMPPKLVETAPPRWRFSRDFSLDYARMHAARGNVVGVAGQVAKAAMEEAHARACEQGRWVLNEKRLIAGSGLGGLADCFVRIPRREVDLALWVDEVARALEA
jgi:hypothetical protein